MIAFAPKLPPHFDSHDVRVVEVADKTNADFMDVNIIGDISDTSKHEELGEDTELGTQPIEIELDAEDGVLVLTADVNTLGLNPDNEDNDEPNLSSKHRVFTTQGNDNGACSEIPSNLDLRTVRLVEVADKTNADHVGVNIIGDINATSKDEGFENDAEM